MSITRYPKTAKKSLEKHQNSSKTVFKNPLEHFQIPQNSRKNPAKMFKKNIWRKKQSPKSEDKSVFAFNAIL